MTRVLVVGSGAREHALTWACLRDGASAVLCAPGNGGTAAIAENLPIPADDVDAILRVARERVVDLVVIGPDGAIAAGLADACNAVAIPVFGPSASAGRVESSKEFAKRLMDGAGIPTARWRAGGSEQRDELRAFAAALGACVVKADGLALGKEVAVCSGAAEAHAAIDTCLLEQRFGDAGRRVVVEERLAGRELSVLAVSDGERVRLLPPARDYKRAYDSDGGPNTGGMGAYAPAPDVGDSLLELVENTVIQPCIDALRERGTAYRGCLYAGLMLTADGPRVLEFNARFGDPEAQVTLPLVTENLLELFMAAALGTLEAGRVALRPGACVGVVAASAGYPESSPTGFVISGLDGLDPDVLCFHAGTARAADGSVRTAGGRVLTVVAHGADVEAARTRGYDNLDRVHFDGMRARRDIAMVGHIVEAAR